MVKPHYIDKYGMNKGAWSEDEDNKLRSYIERFGHPNWRLVPVAAVDICDDLQSTIPDIYKGLKRCGKSCRLRWMNYLRPGIKRGKFTKLEEELIIELHSQLGNKWSAIAENFPDRTDNDIKNYYHAHIKKRKIEATTQAIMPHEMDIDITPLFQEEEIYSDGEIAYWNYNTARFSQADLVGEDCSFDMVESV